MNQVRCVKLNENEIKLMSGKFFCTNSEQLKKLNNTSKTTYCQAESLIKWMHYLKNKYYEDCFHDKEIVEDFIAQIDGILLEGADINDIEWFDKKESILKKQLKKGVGEGK